MLLMSLILILGCVGPRKRIDYNTFVLVERPSAIPETIDSTPIKCPECAPINNQPMIKMSERDFIKIKKKLMELDDYSEYLIDIIESK